MSEKLSFYWWRLKMFLCLINHKWEIQYVRQNNLNKKYSGKKMCVRCYKDNYFNGEFK